MRGPKPPKASRVTPQERFWAVNRFNTLFPYLSRERVARLATLYVMYRTDPDLFW